MFQLMAVFGSKWVGTLGWLVLAERGHLFPFNSLSYCVMVGCPCHGWVDLLSAGSAVEPYYAVRHAIKCYSYRT
jgi:hypothetical protein